MKTHPSIFFRFPLLVLVGLAVWGCVSPLSEGERPCPCAEGWICCAQTRMCTQDTNQCPGGPDAVLPDDTAPAAPRLDSVQPGSPTSDVRVTVAGSAEPG